MSIAPNKPQDERAASTRAGEPDTDPREAQRRLAVRRQTVGLLIVAGLIVLWWLFHTNPAWIFPAGWWRL